MTRHDSIGERRCTRAPDPSRIFNANDRMEMGKNKYFNVLSQLMNLCAFEQNLKRNQSKNRVCARAREWF